MKSKIQSTAEQALEAISIATWDRQRSTAELKDFLSRRESIVADIDL